MTVDRVVPDWLRIAPATADRLLAYADLVTKWTRTVNLVAPASVPDLWGRHILDSAQLWPLIDTDARVWVDLGSGGGLPGLVLAILLAEAQPEARMTLVESDKRKSAFLVQASQELGLKTRVLSQRIEDLPPLGADRLTARALAPLSLLLDHAQRHLLPEGRAYFLKGARHRDELSAGRQHWQFNCRCHASLTETDAALLEIDQIARL